jgi:hypothetical protein
MNTLTIMAFLIVVYYLSKNIIQPTPQVTIGNYQTKYFNLSDGKSKEMFNELRDGGMSPETLTNFAMMEDKFLDYERTSVLFGQDRKIEAIQLSQQIKETFPGYDFSYHIIHIKQISEPNKLINRNIRLV